LKRDEAGWITQEIDGTPSMQRGKVVRVNEWLAERGLSWADVGHSTFYSDSMNDLSLLEAVNTPVATNPSDALRQVAGERGWQVLDLFRKL
jgi:phosphoserine phosphatase